MRYFTDSQYTPRRCVQERTVTISTSMRIARANQSHGRRSCGNTDRIVRAANDAAARGAEVVVCPELSITGYPPRDLVEKSSFLDGSERELERLAKETAHLPLSVICGYARNVPMPRRVSGRRTARL